MQKQIGIGLHGIQLQRVLADNADAHEEHSYTQSYSEEDLIEMKNVVSETSILKNALEDEKKDFNATIKAKIDPLSKKLKETLTKIKHKSHHVTEKCYKVVDTGDLMVGWYNESGILVDQRPLQAGEYVGQVIPFQLNGTND